MSPLDGFAGVRSRRARGRKGSPAVPATLVDDAGAAALAGFSGVRASLPFVRNGLSVDTASTCFTTWTTSALAWHATSFAKGADSTVAAAGATFSRSRHCLLNAKFAFWYSASPWVASSFSNK